MGAFRDKWVRVVIVEDNKSLASVFKEVLEESGRFKVEAIYHNAESLEDDIKNLDAQIVLMDIQLPGIDGVEATKIVKKLRPEIRILVVTVFENSETVFNALCAGASGYLTKNTSSHKLIESLDELMSGGAPMSNRIAKMVIESFRIKKSDLLSEREQEVLTLLSQGKSYQKIGELLFLSVNTIKYHIRNIYDKLQVSNKQDAIEKANRDKLI